MIRGGKSLMYLPNRLLLSIHAIHDSGFKAASMGFTMICTCKKNRSKSLDISEQLINKRDFSNYNFRKNILRPWGPGILYESVFYFLQHLGVKNCYTLGWDLSLSGQLNHYFDNSSDPIYSNSVKGYMKDLKSFEASWSDEMKNVIDASGFIYRYF